MRFCKILALIVLTVVLAIPAIPARADMAPPAVPKIGGLEPFEYQKTEVEMVYERVEIEFVDILFRDHRYMNRARVTAYFLMRNTGKETEQMQAMFPSRGLSCVFDGHGESYTYYSTDDATFVILVDGVRTPVKTITTPNLLATPGGPCGEIPWVGFDVTFPVGKDVVVRISYDMISMGSDWFENLSYILETGAGWKGHIGQAYIIMKFPYKVGLENVLEGTTPGYQTLHNEIFWSFQDLEPTSEDNINISIVAPQAWQSILDLKHKIKENPQVPETWLELANTYTAIAFYHATSLRSPYYRDQVAAVYEQGIAHNPSSAKLLAEYASFQLDMISPYRDQTPTPDEIKSIALLVNKALALEPANETANNILFYLQRVAPDVTFTPFPTIAPTATPLESRTPTPSPSVTPEWPTTPVFPKVTVVVTVVHTRIVTAVPTSVPVLRTQTALPLTPTPTPEAPPVTTSETSGFGWLAWPLLLAFGFVAGVFVAHKKWI